MTEQQTSSKPEAGNPGQRALVLGGGGSTGNAWLIGVVAGLLEAGVDVAAADLTVGTSAGATAAAQLAGATATQLFEAVTSAATSGPAPPGTPGTRPRPGPPVRDHLERTDRIIAEAGSAADARRRIGAAALELEAASDGSWHNQWRETVAARLPQQRWPTRSVLITAVDAGTGDGAAFHHSSGVDLVDAVAASCASHLPYRIGGTAYIDGAYRRNENADLASGSSRVLVLSPLSGQTRLPLEWGTHLAAQVDELRAQGGRVQTVFPDDSVRSLFGVNAMRAALRPAAARAGHEQGTRLASEVAALWL